VRECGFLNNEDEQHDALLQIRVPTNREREGCVYEASSSSQNARIQRKDGRWLSPGNEINTRVKTTTTTTTHVFTL